MKFKVIASDELYARLLKLELERLGMTAVDDNSEDFSLLIAEGQTELPRVRRLRAAILIDCGILSVSIPESVEVLLLSRPFSLLELREFVSGIEDETDESDGGDGIHLYPEDLTVTYKDQSSRLTKREYSLFEYLHSRPGITITRVELLHELWMDENARDTNVVDVYIRFLRTKIDEKFGVKLIRAVRGEGYVYYCDN